MKCPTTAVVTELLMSGAKIFLTNSNGESSFDIALKRSNENIGKLLVSFCTQVRFYMASKGKLYSIELAFKSSLVNYSTCFLLPR